MHDWERKRKKNCQVLTACTRLQNIINVFDGKRTLATCTRMQNARAKRAKLLFSIVEYPSLWRACHGPGRCLSSQMVITMVTWDRIRSDDFLHFMFRMFAMISVCWWLLISVIVICCISSRFLYERWLLKIQAKDWGDAWQPNNMLALWKKSSHGKCGILTICAVNYPQSPTGCDK